jgi:hypothetical protein
MMGTGCKLLLTVGIVLALIVCAGIVLSYFYCDKISSALIEKSTNALETQVLKDLPDGYQVDDIKAAFKDFKDALKSGALKDTLKATKIQAFAKDVQKVLADKKIDKEELDKMLQAMKEIAGKLAP